jgi:EpsI family protein
MDKAQGRRPGQGDCFRMITKRLAGVQFTLLLGFGSIFLLPYANDSSPSGIAMKLPRVVGEWIGDNAAVSTKEREALAKDTQFARKLYYNLAGDQIYVSIVLSGEDMTNSIHRPERCLPAQGLIVVSSQKRRLTLADGKSFQVTKLRTVGQSDSTDGIHVLNYYWFIGYKEMTPSHLTRTWIDLRDRILHGYNQRWAYVTVASSLNQFSGKHSEQEISAMIESFIRQLAPSLRRPDGSALF